MRKWTDEEDELARQLIKQGLSYPEIGARLGRTGDGVRKRLYDKHGMSFLVYSKKARSSAWEKAMKGHRFRDVTLKSSAAAPKFMTPYSEARIGGSLDQ